MRNRARTRLVATLVLAGALLACTSAGTALAGPTVVSITFDDGRADTYVARSILASQNMHGTFYINSGKPGTDTYHLSWDQIAGLAADGHEIGGHTVDHPVLTTLPKAEAQAQVCNDRATLQSHGHVPISFAYPEIEYNAAVQAIVRDCGYHSARAGDAAFPPAETLPPRDPFAIRAVPGMNEARTLAQLKQYVTDVEDAGGGWVVFIGHSLCETSCGGLSITPADFQALVDWLAPRSANGTVVRTVGEVIDGIDVTPPTSSIRCDGAPCSSSPYTGSQITVSLSATDDRSSTSAIRIKYTTDGSDPAVNGVPYSGPFQTTNTTTVRWVATDTTGNADGPNSQTITINPQQQWPKTVVSLTFDDGTATEYFARAQLSSRGMHGTFYINSGRIGTSGYYMNWNQIVGLYADGNEIGGHTSNHVDLKASDPDEAKREICTDRNALLTKGFKPTSLAYPFGSFDARVEQMAQDCGYNSARTTAAVTAETIPPQKPYALRVGSGSGDLAALKAAVTAAEDSGGGWVPIVFHQICNGCDTNWITQDDFAAFLDWLAPRAANGTAVRTVQEVIGGPVKPAVQGPAAPPAANGWNGLRNASLEYDTTTNTTSNPAPDCWKFDGYGENNAVWSRTNDAHSGSWAERVDVTGYKSGDNKLVVAQDLGHCMPTVTPGRRYKVTAWYKSSGPVYFTAFSRDTLGTTSFWTSSPVFPARSTWTQASWTTPVVSSSMNGLSFGLTLTSNGFLTVDDLGLDDASPTGSPDTTAPTATVTAPAAGSTVAGSVSLSASASDNLVLDHVDYLVDGTVIGTRTSAPYTFSWNTLGVANGIHTIVARAVDAAGNAGSSPGVTVNVSNSFTNLLKNPDLETGTATTPTCWQLGGYGTNTHTWARHADAAHSGAFGETLSISSLTNGDRKLVSQQDTGTCAVAAVPGRTYSFSGWYKVPAVSSTTQPVIFAYYRNSAGTWTYWTQVRQVPSTTWRQATWTTPAVPAGATAISVGLGLTTAGAVAMDDFALYDNTPPADTTPPTTMLGCGVGGAQSEDDGCISGYYGAPVQVYLAATDNSGGSGVASIRYTTDGSTPTSTSGSVYMGPFSVGATTTVKYRAFDQAGNAEPVSEQLIKIDTTPPETAITCSLAACESGYYNSAVSVRLGAVDTGGSGVREIRYTTDGTDPTALSGNVYLGAFSVTSTSTVKYRAFDNAGTAEPVKSKTILIDTVAPTTQIYCGPLTPCDDSTYIGSVDISLTAADTGSGVATIRYTTDGTDPTATDGTLYSGPFTVTSTTTVRYRAIDQAGNAEPINVATVRVGASNATLTNPADGTSVSGVINLSVAVGGIAVDHVDFLVDGVVVASDASAPYSRPWDSTTVPDGPHTVLAKVYDTAGGEIDTNAAQITVSNVVPDTTPPVSVIACNGGPCQADAYSASVSVTLSASDAGGSGVASIRYTTDDSEPTPTHGTVYTGAFSVTSTSTVRYRGFDAAGNAEAVQSQVIEIDTVAPTSSIFCNGGACAGSYYNAPVRVSLAASDSGGAGVDLIRYTTDGSDPTTTNGSTFSDDFQLSATTRVRWRAYDSAGNVEPINGALIRIDTTPPATTIACNGGSCSGAFLPGAVVTLAATDADSGVASIRYTTNGSDPTATTGTVYAAPFSLNATATVKYRAFDGSGHAEAVKSQLVRIDSAAPTVSLTAPASGAAVSGDVPLSADASDNTGVDRVEFQVDGTTVATDSSAPYSASWDSRSLANGVHSIRARAVDLAGNAANSSAASVTSANGTNLLQNPSLETGTATTPTCWLLGGFGTNTHTWSRNSDAHAGSFGETLTVSAFTNGDRKLVSTQDAGACAPSAIPGRTYTVTAWYKSTAQPVIFAYYRNSAGAWVYWTQSPKLPVSAGWTQASWVTPAAPTGATAISIGPGLQSTGVLTMDELALFANG